MQQTPRWKREPPVKRSAFGPSGFDSLVLHHLETGCFERRIV